MQQRQKPLYDLFRIPWVSAINMKDELVELHQRISRLVKPLCLIKWLTPTTVLEFFSAATRTKIIPFGSC